MSHLGKSACAGLTEEQAQRAKERAESLLKEASGDPKLFKELMEKMGFSPWEAAKSFGSATGKWLPGLAAQTAAGMLVGGAIGVGGSMMRKSVEATAGKLGKAKAYKQMIEARPELREKDPKRVQMAFDSLYRFNPEYAKDPLVASSFVDNVATSERLDLNQVNALVSARKSMTDTAGAGPDPTRFIPRPSAADPEKRPLELAKLQRDAEPPAGETPQGGEMDRMARMYTGPSSAPPAPGGGSPVLPGEPY